VIIRRVVAICGAMSVIDLHARIVIMLSETRGATSTFVDVATPAWMYVPLP
jgi:hypothetical protein